MQLRLTDGTTTIDLSGATPGIRGCTWFPLPGDGQTTVTETAELVGAGTQAQIRAATASIERLLETARRRRATGMGSRVWLEYRPVSTDSLYRSELYDGRVVWSEEPGARRLDWPNPVVRFDLLLERAPWWEGPETELALTGSGQSTPQTGGRLLTNNGVANWVQAANVEGTLPAPLKLRLTQTTESGIFYTRFYLGVNAFGNPTTFTHLLQGESMPAGYGTNSASTDASGGQLRVVTATTSYLPRAAWTIPASMTAVGGRWFRLILRKLGGIPGRVLMRPRIHDESGLNLLWEGQEVVWDGATELVDLGAAPIPPGPWVSGYSAVQLQVWMQTEAGAVSINIDYLLLLPTDAWRHVYVVGMQWPQGSVIMVDELEGALYGEGDGEAFPLLIGDGGPLVVWPGETNRLVLVEHASSDAGTVNHTFSARLFYRPRRSTI